MSSATYHSVRLEPTMKEYIEEVHEKLETYHSIKHFSERAVANNAEYLERQVKGADDLRQLIRVLCRADGISISLSEDTIGTKLRDEALNSATKLELTPQQLNSIEKITTSTGLTKGGAIRVCLIRELYKLSSSDELLHEPRQRDIQSSWTSIESNVEELFSSIQSKLETKFVKQLDNTRRKVQEDPKARDEVIAHYEHYFEDSAGYKRLQRTERGREILSGLESLPHGEE
jgi:hypothetical protein